MKNRIISLIIMVIFLIPCVSRAGTGYAVLVGVVQAGDPNYDDRATAGSANDVNLINMLLLARGFDQKNVICLTTRDQTRPQFILSTLKQHIKKVTKDDLFVFYFSGHGTQKEDKSLPTDEDDGLDEYLVGFQGDICDDDLADVWQSSNAGARLVVILDACHSGKIPRFARRKATADHPYEVPVPEYVTLAELPHLAATNRSRTGLRRIALATRGAARRRTLSNCLSETIDIRQSYHLIYLGAVLDEESAVTSPDGRGKFTSKLVALTNRYPGASYRDFARRLLASEENCSSEAAYAELGRVPEDFANSFFLQP